MRKSAVLGLVNGVDLVAGSRPVSSWLVWCWLFLLENAVDLAISGVCVQIAGSHGSQKGQR